MSARQDVIVIGGGVVGLACARALLAAGRDVLVLEAGRVGAGASYGNCGLITPSHALPLTRPKMMRQVLRSMLRPDAPIRVKPRLDLSFVAWGLRFVARCSEAGMLDAMRGRGALLELSRSLFDDWIASGMDCEWQEAGMLEVFATEAGRSHAAGVAHLLADHGIQSQDLDAEDLAQREPALEDGLAGARFYPRDAHLRPDRLVSELARVVREAGGRIEEERPATDVRAGRVATALGTLEAEEVVVAAGAWTPRVLEGTKIPIQPGKGYSITTERPDPCPRLPLLLAEANMAVTPWPSGLRLGGTMEFAGYDERLNRTRVDALRKGAARFLREAAGERPVEWWGWRPMTPDELPILARLEPGLVIAAGHAMLGVSMAPATGELIAALVTGSEPPVDPRPYRLSRF